MRLFVQQPSWSPSVVDAEEALILLGNTWNDYSYRTLYTLYLKRDNVIRELGPVKILRRGQREVEVPLPVGEVPSGALDDDYSSLGNSLDYYVGLRSLGDNTCRQILLWLNDLAFNEPKLKAFGQEPGLRLSLYRNHAKPDDFYIDARSVVESGGALPGAQKLEFTYHWSTGGSPVNFRFCRAPERHPSPFTVGPSRRVVVLTGANGVGKTQLLARLARLAYAPPAERQQLAQDGRLEDAPAFASIVAVSYSAFDTFEPPTIQGDSPQEIVKTLRQGSGRYVFCGMRDLAARFENPPRPNRVFNESELAIIFSERLQRVRDRGRFELLSEVLAPLFSDVGFSRHLDAADLVVNPDDTQEIPSALFEGFLANGPVQAFGNLSSGHKIVLHLLTSLTATLNRRGLALIDEPETHLHPPLLAALMAGLRSILDRLESYAIVATHSPVVAQETLASQVLVLEVYGQIAAIRPVQIETFGENVGTLTREIFGLHTAATDYRNVLDSMIRIYRDIASIEEELGGPLSGPALAHVMSVLKPKS